MPILTIISFKGGVGKSVISQNIAVSYAKDKKDVVILDADPNKSTTIWHSYRPDDIAPVDVFHAPKEANLIKLINTLAEKYEYVIVDCPPALENITTMAVAKSDMSIIPVATTGGNDIWATEEFLKHLDILRAKFDAILPAFIVLNRFEANVKLHQAYLEVIRSYEEEYDIKRLDTILGKRTAYGEANTQGLGVLEWENPKAKKEVKSLIAEIEQLLEKLNVSTDG